MSLGCSQEGRLQDSHFEGMEGRRLQGCSLRGVDAMEGRGGIGGWVGLVQRIETNTEQVMEDGGERWGPKGAILHKDSGEEYCKI